MAGDPFYKNHWINIERDRLDRYQRLFQFSPASLVLYEPADIRPGQIVAKSGCTRIVPLTRFFELMRFRFYSGSITSIREQSREELDARHLRDDQ